MAEILRDELLSDPLGRSYSTMSDQEATDDLNTEYRSRNRTSMKSTEVFNAIDVSEFIALADGNRNTVMQIVGFGDINPFGKEADVFISIFGGGSETIIALALARMEPISRAVELGLRLIPVRRGHVEEARA